MKRLLLPLIAALALPTAAAAEGFYLYFGTYQSAERPNKVYDNTYLHASSFSSLSKCKAAGEKIFNEIYKPTKFFDGRWTCVEK